jgi:hypothetical protein
MKSWTWCWTLAWLAAAACGGSAEPAAETTPAAAPASTGAESAPAPAPAPTAPTVTLRFAWPDGSTAHVRSTLIKDRGDKVQRSEQRYRVHTQRDAAGLRIVEDAGELLASEGHSPAEQNLLQAFGTASMTSRVSPDGEFLEVEDASGYVERVRAALKTQLPADQYAGVEQIVTTELLQGSAAARWNERVGMWIGSPELELGAVYEFRSTARLPLPGQPEVAMLTRFSAKSIVPCREGLEARCVEIETTQAPDPADLERAVREMMAKVAGSGLPPFKIEKLDTTVSMTLVTDPSTLLPYHFDRKKRIEVVITGAPTTHASEHETVEYEYEPAQE